MTDAHNISAIVWGFAETLWPAVEKADYHRIILPLTLVRRFDYYLEPYREATARVLAQFRTQLYEDGSLNDGLMLNLLQAETGQETVRVYNASPLTFQKLLDDPANILVNIDAYMGGFSENIQDILSNFELKSQLKKLHNKGKLIPLLQDFANADFLRPENLSNNAMGVLYEDLIRKWADSIKAAAGEFFTPRDIVKLLVELVFVGGKEFIRGSKPILSTYDPTAGSGGMLTVADEEGIVAKYFPNAEHHLYGQELKELPYAICKADMLLKDKDDSRIRRENTLTCDLFAGQTFNFALSNPPYGSPWATDAKAIEAEHAKGKHGRFPAGLPRKDDGSMLFIQHLVSKMDPKGARVGIVLAGSPLFNGDAGSGESEIRRWLLENDYLETLVALPTELFFDTAIATYLWILTNKKEVRRRGKVQLIDARNVFEKMRRGIGDKKREITDDCRQELVTCWQDFCDGPISKVFDNEFFGHRRLCIERPVQVECTEVALRKSLKQLRAWLKLTPAWKTVASKWSDDEVLTFFQRTSEVPRETVNGVQTVTLTGLPDARRRDYETVPLGENAEEYFARSVQPYLPGAWLDKEFVDAKVGGLGKIGYDFNFNRYFQESKEFPSPAALKAQIEAAEAEFVALMRKVLA